MNITSSAVDKHNLKLSSEYCDM